MHLLTEITLADIEPWVRCSSEPHEKYSEDNLRLLAGGDSITPLAVCDLPIPDEDKLWVLLRPEIISEKRLRLLAALIAEHVLHIFEDQFPGDNRSRNVIEAARAFARGEISHDELRVAAETAHAAYAANVAAETANAAYAAYAAADAETAYAATAAATAAADAADAAAYAAECKWQVEQVREVLQEMETQTEGKS